MLAGEAGRPCDERAYERNETTGNTSSGGRVIDKLLTKSAVKTNKKSDFAMTSTTDFCVFWLVDTAGQAKFKFVLYHTKFGLNKIYIFWDEQTCGVWSKLNFRFM